MEALQLLASLGMTIVTTSLPRYILGACHTLPLPLTCDWGKFCRPVNVQQGVRATLRSLQCAQQSASPP